MKITEYDIKIGQIVYCVVERKVRSKTNESDVRAAAHSRPGILGSPLHCM